MDELFDQAQYDEYCRIQPVTPGEWEEIKYAFRSGMIDDSPYLLDDKTAIERAKEMVH